MTPEDRKAKNQEEPMSDEEELPILTDEAAARILKLAERWEEQAKTEPDPQEREAIRRRAREVRAVLSGLP